MPTATARAWTCEHRPCQRNLHPRPNSMCRNCLIRELSHQLLRRNPLLGHTDIHATDSEVEPTQSPGRPCLNLTGWAKLMAGGNGSGASSSKNLLESSQIPELHTSPMHIAQCWGPVNRNLLGTRNEICLTTCVSSSLSLLGTEPLCNNGSQSLRQTHVPLQQIDAKNVGSWASPTLHPRYPQRLMVLGELITESCRLSSWRVSQRPGLEGTSTPTTFSSSRTTFPLLACVTH